MMKRIIPFCLCLFLFASCAKNDDQPERLPEPTYEPSESYILNDISFSMEDGDGKTERLENFPKRTYTNNTSVMQHFTFAPLESVRETSHFQSEDQDAFSLSNVDLTKFATPIAITDDGRIQRGGQKWPYSNQIAQLAPSVAIKDSTDILPYHTVTMNVSAVMNVYKLTYTATFIGQTSGKERKVKGKWQGTILGKTSVDYKDSKNEEL